MTRPIRLVPWLLALALLASACLGGTKEPVPDVVNRYLAALVDGDIDAAFDLTTLDDYSAGPGFALSLEHFRGFYQRQPLERFSVIEVFRQEITERLGTPGQPFWTVDVDLVYADGTQRQSMYVEGRITSLHRVQIEPTAIAFLLGEGFPDTVLVDGVATPVQTAGERTAVTVLRGEHEIMVGDTTLHVRTDPLSVVSGPAVVDEGPPAAVALTG